MKTIRLHEKKTTTKAHMSWGETIYLKRKNCARQQIAVAIMKTIRLQQKIQQRRKHIRKKRFNFSWKNSGYFHRHWMRRVIALVSKAIDGSRQHWMCRVVALVGQASGGSRRRWLRRVMALVCKASDGSRRRWMCLVIALVGKASDGSRWHWTRRIIALVTKAIGGSRRRWMRRVVALVGKARDGSQWRWTSRVTSGGSCRWLWQCLQWP